MIRHYVRHWSQYATKIFVYDDDSTDGTREYLASCAPLVEVKSPGFQGIDELLLQQMRNREYKIHSRGKADWVVIGDSDELHYHPHLLSALEEKKKLGYCAVISHGFQMLAEKPPSNGQLMTDAIRDGIRDMRYSRVIFNPEIDMAIGVGHHSFRILDPSHPRAVSFSPKGHLRREITTPDALVKYPIEQTDHKFRMLHYHYLGLEYVRDRHSRTWARCSERNRQNGWGSHGSPENTGMYSLEWYQDALRRKHRVI